MQKLVFVVSGGVSEYAKQQKDTPSYTRVIQAYQYAWESIGLKYEDGSDLIDGAVASYTPMPSKPDTAATVMEYLGLSTKPLIRIDQDGAMGGICFQEAVRQVSEKMDICLAYAWEETVIPGLTDNDHAMRRNATSEHTAKVLVKNYRNGAYNRYARRKGLIDLGNGKQVAAAELTIEHAQESAAGLNTCDVSEGATVCLLASIDGLRTLKKAGAKLRHAVIVSGMGRASSQPLPKRTSNHQKDDTFSPPCAPARSSEVVQTAACAAYAMAKVKYPFWELDFVETHDTHASHEIRTYEHMGLCRRGDGRAFLDEGFPFLNTVNYGKALKNFPKRRVIGVNPSGGVIACGHSGAATGLCQTVFSLWQIQGAIKDHFGSHALQVPNARRGAIHSRTQTGMVTVSILEC